MKITGKDKAVLAAGQILFVDEQEFKRKDDDGRMASSYAIQDLPVDASPDDFVQIPFRQISATTVGSGSWKATDFSKYGVLEKALPMFKGKTVYRNHEMYIGNHVGVIGMAEWQGETVTAEGKQIPAGINAPFIIDSKIHPVLARELKSPYPPVRSVSISVEFEWEASHEFEDMWGFIDNLGEKIDGEEVRRIVTNIIDISESSLVWEGADPFAKMLGKDGKVMFSAENYAKKRLGINDVKSSKQEEEEMKYDNILSLLGAETLELADEKSKTVLVVGKVEHEKMLESFESLKKETVELKAKIKENEAYAAYGKELKNAKIDEAKRLYIASLGAESEPSQAMIADIEGSSFDVLNEKIKLFGGKVESHFTRTCNDCGSQSVSLKSSGQPDHKEGFESVETEDIEL